MPITSGGNFLGQVADQGALVTSLGGGPTGAAKAAATSFTKAAQQAQTDSAREISQEGKPYHCKEGWYLTWDGAGNHVCRSRSTGATEAVIPNGADGGGGGGTAAPTALSGQGAATGSDYLSGPGADIFANNPQAMAADLLNRQYGDSNTGLGLLQQLAPYGDAANVLFLAERGQDAEGGTKEDFLGWLEDYWTNLMTPGASLGDPAALWENITNPAQNSPLVSYLAVQDPEQQARNFRSLAAGIMGTYYHPLIADAVMDNMAYRQDAFLGEAARGAEDPFYQWFAADAPFFERMY